MINVIWTIIEAAALFVMVTAAITTGSIPFAIIAGAFMLSCTIEHKES